MGRFWTVFCNKSRNLFAEMYFPRAIVFSTSAKRTEPGSLTVARRTRTFLDSPMSLVADLGSIEVQVCGDNTAIATYTYAFQTTQTNSDGSRTRRSTPHARATQIFQRDEQGTLRIVHEHFSSATPPTTETLAQS